MDNKKLGIILIVISIVLIIILGYFRIQLERSLETQIMSTEGGVCTHIGEKCPYELINEMLIPTIIGVALIAVMLALALYLIFFEKSQKAIISTLEKQKQIQKEEEKFNIFLKGLSEDEKKVIKAIKEQDGITQQTLRLRADMHKSKLSIVLDGLEKKGLIARKEKGKTKQVFLKVAL